MKNFYARFDAKIEKTDACWIWKGALSEGYGRFRLDGGSPRPAHRVAYERQHGPIPEGFILDHFRLNSGPRQAPCSKACVNPDHLELVTNRENLLRGRTITAKNAAATHCPVGHPYNKTNTIPHPRGWRRCRLCNLAKMAARYHNKKMEGQERVHTQ